MPSEIGPSDDEVADLRVTTAPVIEFQFGLFLVRRTCIDPDKPVPEWVGVFSEQEPALLERLTTFWSGPGLDRIDGRPHAECGELLVAGWKMGALLAPSSGPFLDGLDRTLAAGVPVPTLASEPDSVVELIRRRLEFLSTDSAARAEYVGLTRAFFGKMAEYWERSGKVVAERAVEDIRALLRGGADLRAALPGNMFIHRDEFQASIVEARASHQLVVVPLGLGGAGNLFWSFPDLLLVGVGTESAEKEARRRERAERVANRLKVLSDPTRVSILLELLVPTWNSSTVTELARQFELSQPTVSVHIKMLREAGLARPERDGNQVHYKADAATVETYLAGVAEDIVGVSRIT